MFGLGRMTAGQVVIRIQLLNQRAGFMSPLFVAVDIQVVSEIPGYVGEAGQARSRVMNVSSLIFAGRCGVNAGVPHVQHQRDDRATLPCVAEHSVELLPIGHIEARIIEAGMIEVFGRLCWPGI